MTNRPLSNLNIERFGKILGMLVERTDDHSKLNAISRANTMLSNAGLSWNDITAALTHSANEPATTTNPFAGFADILKVTYGSPTPKAESAANKRTMPRKILQNKDIPNVIYGQIEIQDISDGKWGQSLIVNVFDATLNTSYGPLRIFNDNLVGDILQRPSTNKLKTFFKVKQPSHDGHLPVLTPRPS